MALQSTLEAFFSEDQAGKLQTQLTKNGIPINLSTNEGLGTILCVTDSDTASAFPYHNGSKDLSRSVLDDELLSIRDHIMGEHGMSAYIFRPDDGNRPRLLFWNAAAKDFEISVPFDEIRNPHRPCPFHRVIHWLTGAYQSEEDTYEQERRLYARTVPARLNRTFRTAVAQRMSSPEHLYSIER